jgi:phage shock protein C
MYCTHCGRALRSEFDNFCPHCGEETSHHAATRVAAPRRLYRLAYDKKIAGVCSGIAKYLDIDVNLVRVLAILLLVFSCGLALVGYIAAWILIPEERVQPSPMVPQQTTPVST